MSVFFKKFVQKALSVNKLLDYLLSNNDFLHDITILSYYNNSIILINASYIFLLLCYNNIFLQKINKINKFQEIFDLLSSDYNEILNESLRSLVNISTHDEYHEYFITNLHLFIDLLHKNIDYTNLHIASIIVNISKNLTYNYLLFDNLLIDPYLKLFYNSNCFVKKNVSISVLFFVLNNSVFTSDFPLIEIRNILTYLLSISSYNKDADTCLQKISLL